MATDGAASSERVAPSDVVATHSSAEDAYVSPLVDFLLVLSVVMPLAVGSVALVLP